MWRAVFLVLAFTLLSDGNTVRFSYTEKPGLQWTDFEGRPDLQSPYAATANTGISQSFMIESNGHLVKDSVEITAYFYPKLSWYKPEFATSILLRHERGHFAISELHARMLRKKIHDFEFSFKAHKQIDSLYNVVEKERLFMQAQFDRETVHSRNGEREQVWEKRIKEELAELNDWTSEN